MKIWAILIFLGSNLLANDVEAFFNASKDNFLLCRAGYETYMMISSANASIVTINGTKFFRYKHEDYYFPLSSCNSVKEYKETSNQTVSR